MGDYADLILDGAVDMYTGEYLGEGYCSPRHSSDYKQRRKKYKYTLKELQEMPNIKLGNLIQSKAKYAREKLEYYQSKGRTRIDIRTLKNDVKQLVLYKERKMKRELEQKNYEKGLKAINKESISEVSEEVFIETGDRNDDK